MDTPGPRRRPASPAPGLSPPFPAPSLTGAPRHSSRLTPPTRLQLNALCLATTSFPRMGAAAGGLQACPVGGHSVLHLQCGSGALTKMLASKGLRVCGADGDVAAAAKRGLRAFPYGGSGGSGSGAGGLAPGALAGARGKGPYDVVLFYQQAGAAEGLSLEGLLSAGTLSEVAATLAPGGRLCAEADGADAGAAAAALQAAGWAVNVAQEGPRPGRVRLVAQAPRVAA
jgi:hypothetical protein